MSPPSSAQGTIGRFSSSSTTTTAGTLLLLLGKVFTAFSCCMALHKNLFLPLLRKYSISTTTTTNRTNLRKSLDNNSTRSTNSTVVTSTRSNSSSNNSNNTAFTNYKKFTSGSIINKHNHNFDYNYNKKFTTTATSTLTTTTATRMVSLALLQKQNADTSNALIEHWKDSATFAALAKYEGDLTMQRDDEDGVKLEKGIEFAKSKGVIDPNYVPEPYVTLDVLGKTPDTVAGEILAKIKENNEQKSSGGGEEGSVIVLCGLSGTGKGTTVTKLRQKLEEDEGKKVVTWSNGNIFRSVTLLAVTWCEQQSDIPDGVFDKDKALTKENLQSFMSMLSFGKFDNGIFDTRINGLGLDMLVSQVQNTELKSPKVSKNIPTVAEVTQGEVILFAANAVETMGKDGLFVLLEGREQTVNYVRTPLRFTLVLSDESLIGKRRAAQRLMADALPKVPEGASDEDVHKILEESLEAMAKEIH